MKQLADIYLIWHCVVHLLSKNKFVVLMEVNEVRLTAGILRTQLATAVLCIYISNIYCVCAGICPLNVSFNVSLWQTPITVVAMWHPRKCDSPVYSCGSYDQEQWWAADVKFPRLWGGQVWAAELREWLAGRVEDSCDSLWTAWVFTLSDKNE